MYINWDVDQKHQKKWTLLLFTSAKNYLRCILESVISRKRSTNVAFLQAPSKLYAMRPSIAYLWVAHIFVLKGVDDWWRSFPFGNADLIVGNVLGLGDPCTLTGEISGMKFPVWESKSRPSSQGDLSISSSFRNMLTNQFAYSLTE